MSDPKNLVFYNKEGFPYNFTYNTTSEKWEGKLLFEENSSDLFKTIGIYTFEDVQPTSYTGIVDFKKIETYNNSGISFTPYTYSDTSISDIQKVNSSSQFYSKWIYGDRIDSKFPIGTVITFSGVTSIISQNDFDSSVYFDVLRTRKGAVMVVTKTKNSIFDITNYSFSNATISSHNIVEISEYKSELDTFFNELYIDKKISVINSSHNDTVYSVIAKTKTYSTVYDFIMTGNTTQFLELEVDLYTERPQLYDGNITISGSTYTDMKIKFENGLNSDFQVGQEIIFTDSYGENISPINTNQYLITNIVDNISLGTYRLDFNKISTKSAVPKKTNLITLTGSTSLIIGDRMLLTGSTISSHSGRIFKIISINTSISGLTIYQIDQPVNYEVGSSYQILKLIPTWEQDTVVTTEIGMNTSIYSGPALCYLDTNIIKYSQQILSSGSTISYSNTINSFNVQFRSLLNLYGIDTYYLSGNSDYFVVEGLYDYSFSGQSYFSAITRIKNSDGTIYSVLNTGGTLVQSDNTSEKYYIEVDKQLKKERVYLYEKDKLSQNYHAEIVFNLVNDITMYGFTLNINTVVYNISYNILGTNNTILDFINKYYNILYNNGIVISCTTDTLFIDGLTPDINVYELLVTVNNFSTYTINNVEGSQVIIISGNELKSPLNDFLNIGLSTGMIINASGSTYPANNKAYNILGLSGDTIQLSYQGLFFDETGTTSTINSREYLRKPRGTTGRDIWYKFEWNAGSDVSTQINNIQTPDIFFYDITGDQLVPYNNISTLTYSGPKPLFNTGDCNNNQVYLNVEPNVIVDDVSNPQKQQTIFNSLLYKLERYEDSSDYNYLPEPMQTFIGFNSKTEGVSQAVLSLKQLDNIIFSGASRNQYSPYDYFTISDYELRYWTNNQFDFRLLGFSDGQLLSIQFYDTTSTGQTLFRNYDNYEISDVTAYKIIFKTQLEYFNSSASTFNFVIQTVPKEIGLINVYGETEIEDVRLDINLKSLGIHISHNEEKIFKESDIEENGVDYILLNKKRKEMLSNFTEIYPYVGSYKAMINAINYFGYNDLEIYEYYRNVTSNSPLYGKLFRTHIPNMFDLSTEGWNEVNQIKDSDTNHFAKTNLFNLTYNITDSNGTNVNMYSLDEVQIKLKSLVKWLEKFIIPLSANIKDLTGVSNIINILYQKYDSSNRAKKCVTIENSMVINYTIYSTLNFGTNYLIVLDFYTNNGLVPDSFTARIKTFRAADNGRLYPVQYFNLLKTDLSSFRFNVDSQIDPYIYIELTYYNDNGVGMTNYQLQKFDERKNYMLVNYQYLYKYVPYIQTNGTQSVINNDLTLSNFYLIDEQNNFWLLLTKFLQDYWKNEIVPIS